MKKAYLKAIAAGIIGVVIIFFFLAFSAFMLNMEMNEYYKEPRGYDNDMIGLFWMMVFGSLSFLTILFTGALGVRLASGHISTIKEAIMVSALAGAVPSILMILFSMAFGVLSYFSGPSRSFSLIDAIGYTLSTGYMTCGFYIIFIGLALSITGGLIYWTLLKDLKMGEVKSIMQKSGLPLKTGTITGIVILSVHMAGYLIGGGSYSPEIFFIEFISFFVLAIVAGIITSYLIGSAENPFKETVIALAKSGAIAGIFGAVGRSLINIANNYNVLYVLVFEGIKYLIGGIVLAFIGGLLYVTLSRKYEKWYDHTDVKPDYINSIKIGALAGAILTGYTILPHIIVWALSLLNIHSDYPIIMILMILGGLTGFIVFIIVLAAAVILALRSSQVKNLRDAVIASCMTGISLSLINMIGDVCNTYLSANYFVGSDPYITSIYLANIQSNLSGAPFKMLTVTVLMILIGILYSIWILKLEKQGDKSIYDEKSK